MRRLVLICAGLLAATCLALASGCAAARGQYGAAGPIPRFSSSERCPHTNASACGHLDSWAGGELTAPPGARVYRETWASPWEGPMRGGAIVLTVHPDGRRILETPWARDRLAPHELPDFEATLARSDFAERPVYNQAQGVCIGGVATSIEAVVDGEYRLVYFDYCGGVTSEGVAQALDQLFVFAADQAGLEYPVNPDRPTFRGY